MKQDIATYLVDSFIDFAGKEHKIVACALSQSPDDKEDNLRIGWVNKEGYMDIDNPLCPYVYRMVTVGIAICNPCDNFDEETGKRIAYNKAANIENLPRIYSTIPGIITKEIVNTFLKQQVEFVKDNPEKLILGYNKSKAEYEKINTIKNQIEQFTDEERVAFELALKGVNLTKFNNLATVYKNKIAKNE